MLKHAGHRRLIISKNLILMLVLLVVVGISIFAWFTSNEEAEASGISIKAKAVDYVELALPEKVNDMDSFPKSNDSWDTEIDFKSSGYFKDLVKDITSDGEQFVIPNFEVGLLEQGRRVITDDIWEEGLSSKEALTNTRVNDDDQYNYISLDFYIRSKNRNISIESNSFLAAGSEVGYNGTTTSSNNIKPLKGSDIYRISTYGAAEGKQNAFSADAIVGAMRVSLIGAPVDGISTNGSGITSETTFDGGTWEAKSDLRFLWLPRPDLYLKTDNDSNNWKLYTGIKPTGNVAQNDLTAAQINALADESYAHSFYNGNIITGDVKKGLTEGRYSDSSVKNISDTTHPDVFKVSQTTGDTHLGDQGYYPKLGQKYRIASGARESSKNIQFSAGTAQNDNRDTSGYYVYKYTMNIWIEGEDAEARRSMNSGVFNMELNFGS